MPILVRLAPEIFVKSKAVRWRFQKKLLSNIGSAFPGSEIKLIRHRIFLYEDIEKAEPILERIFGIQSFSDAVEIRTDIQTIRETALLLAQSNKKARTFAIATRRPYKEFPLTSFQVNREVGEFVRQNTPLEVNLDKPDIRINIEIHKGRSYVFTDSHAGPAGLPYGTQGRMLCIYENKDSLAAAWMMMKRGAEIIVLLGTEEQAEPLRKWAIGIPLKTATGCVENAMKSCDVAVYGTTNLKKIKKLPYVAFHPLAALPADKLNEIRAKV
jgi:thiamine biosynthesis protein ThiI